MCSSPTKTAVPQITSNFADALILATGPCTFCGSRELQREQKKHISYLVPTQLFFISHKQLTIIAT